MPNSKNCQTVSVLHIDCNQ